MIRDAYLFVINSDADRLKMTNYLMGLSTKMFVIDNVQHSYPFLAVVSFDPKLMTATVHRGVTPDDSPLPKPTVTTNV